jgi:hypothetical protein
VIAHQGERNRKMPHRKMPLLDHLGFASCDAVDGLDDGYLVAREQGLHNPLGAPAIDAILRRR